MLRPSVKKSIDSTTRDDTDWIINRITLGVCTEYTVGNDRQMIGMGYDYTDDIWGRRRFGIIGSFSKM